jgi:hypothetical protein
LFVASIPFDSFSVAVAHSRASPDRVLRPVGSNLAIAVSSIPVFLGLDPAPREKIGTYDQAEASSFEYDSFEMGNRAHG